MFRARLSRLVVVHRPFQRPALLRLAPYLSLYPKLVLRLPYPQPVLLLPYPEPVLRPLYPKLVPRLPYLQPVLRPLYWERVLLLPYPKLALLLPYPKRAPRLPHPQAWLALAVCFPRLVSLLRFVLSPVPCFLNLACPRPSCPRFAVAVVAWEPLLPLPHST